MHVIMKTMQIILNVLGMLYFSTILVHGLIDLRAEFRVTELDRAGVFNEEALMESFPKLAENPRYLVAEYIAGDYRRRVHALAVIGLFIVTANLVIACLCGRRSPKKQENGNIRPLISGGEHDYPCSSV